MPAKTKSTKKVSPTECIGFISGGIIKANHLYVFTSTSVDAKQYVENNLKKYFGNVSGRYIKVNNATVMLENFLTEAETKKYILLPEQKQLIQCGVKEASELMKNVTESKTITTFKFSSEEKKQAKPKSAQAAKKVANNDTDNSDIEEKKPPRAKPAQAAKKVVNNDTDNSDDEQPIKTKPAQVPKPAANISDDEQDEQDKQKQTDSDSDALPKKPKTQAKSAKSGKNNGKQNKPAGKKVNNKPVVLISEDDDQSEDEQPKKPTKMPAKPQGKTTRFAISSNSDTD